MSQVVINWMEDSGLPNSAQKFTEVQGWLLLTFIICLYNFISIIVQDIWKSSVTLQIDSNNESLLLSVTYGETWVGFCLNVPNAFS